MINTEEKRILTSYLKKDVNYWKNHQEKNCLEIFKSALMCPGYKLFLKKQGVNTTKIKNYESFSKLPFINKTNYFHYYGFKQTLSKDTLEKKAQVLTSTSGSTGEPTYFARTEKLDYNFSVLAEFFLNNGPKGPTLFLDCFGMGVWIGGLMTYQAFRYASLRGYPLSILTPGINKKEIFHALKKLAPNYKNLILAGYPPFIKDTIDEAKTENIDFSKFNVRLLFAAESFTEKFRDYLAEKIGIRNVHYDTLNIYGSAELGAMAFETPLSIFIRRLALQNQEIYKELFQSFRQPTLAQYNPDFICFEEQNGQILVTAENSCPFIRYNIGDNGGVYNLSTIAKAFDKNGIDLKKIAQKEKIPYLNLPFVYIYERSDLSTKLYGAIIYPEHIREAIQCPELLKILTGKFVISTEFDKNNDEYLQIHLELKPSVKVDPGLEEKVKDAIIKNMTLKNAEYRNCYTTITQKVIPKLSFWQYGHTLYFKEGIKQKWVNKNAKNN